MKPFEAGSDLWITPQAETADLTKELNWYANFLMSKASHYERPALSADLEKVLEENELEVLKKSPRVPNRVLISSSHLLPNRFLLVLPYKKDLQAWLEEAHEVWQGLGRPTLRFFLPKDIDVDQFTKAWPEKGIGQQVTLVSL